MIIIKRTTPIPAQKHFFFLALFYKNEKRKDKNKNKNNKKNYDHANALKV